MAVKKRTVLNTEIQSSFELIEALYAARNASFKEEEHDAIDSLLPIESLDNMDDAVSLLMTSIQQDEKIMIAGDFDADGATSCALSVGALRLFGCTKVDFIVPNRFKFGYGLSKEIVDIIAENKPDLLITVDSGISCFEGIKHARSLGIKVLVTDHHLQAETLPEANAFLNPNLKGSAFKSKSLAGVGVSFYLMSAMKKALMQEDWFLKRKLPEPDINHFLDLVALGTIADVAALDRNNRILVREGLKRVREGLGCPGINVLTRISQRQTNILTSGDLGFALGPRLNAAGRLKDMSIGIQCLLAETEEEAETFAEELNQLNATRRNIESNMKNDAAEIISNMQLDGESLPKGLTLYDPQWHQGVIGILASRMKESWKRPVAVFTRSEKEGQLKGSTRSINGVHIRDVLNTIKTFHPEYIVSFGGHAMAAGISIFEEHFDAFSKAFDGIVTEEMNKLDNLDEKVIDCTLPPDLIDINMAECINTSGPWGQQFPEPLFDGYFNVIAQRIVGEHHLRFTLSALNEPVLIDAIKFYFDQEKWPNYDCNRVYLIFRLTINEYRGIRKPQLVIEHIEPEQLKTRAKLQDAFIM